MGTPALKIASGGASHATGAGIEAAVQARAMFKMGPFVAVEMGIALYFEREPQRADALRCSCGDRECRVDVHHADMMAVQDIPGETADTQNWLSYWAYRIHLDQCYGTPRALGLDLEARA
jgi:hypothetical protein